MSNNMRVTRSRGGGTRTPRLTLRNRPPTPRGQGTSTAPRTPSPSRTRRSLSRNSIGSASSRCSTGTSSSRPTQLNNKENINQEEQLVDSENTNQPGEAEQPTLQPEGEQLREENQQVQPSNQSRPPTPNWTGFTPEPNFQEARENDRQDFETGEMEDHPSYSKIWNRVQVVAMEPLSIDNNFYMDYRNPQSIKFFNKGVEKLPGEAFTRKNIFSWLKRLQIKAIPLDPYPHN
jgi:hypothetical protein